MQPGAVAPGRIKSSDPRESLLYVHGATVLTAVIHWLPRRGKFLDFALPPSAPRPSPTIQSQRVKITLAALTPYALPKHATAVCGLWRHQLRSDFAAEGFRRLRAATEQAPESHSPLFSVLKLLPVSLDAGKILRTPIVPEPYKCIFCYSTGFRDSIHGF